MFASSCVFPERHADFSVRGVSGLQHGKTFSGRTGMRRFSVENRLAGLQACCNAFKERKLQRRNLRVGVVCRYPNTIKTKTGELLRHRFFIFGHTQNARAMASTGVKTESHVTLMSQFCYVKNSSCRYTAMQEVLLEAEMRGDQTVNARRSKDTCVG